MSDIEARVENSLPNNSALKKAKLPMRSLFVADLGLTPF